MLQAAGAMWVQTERNFVGGAESGCGGERFRLQGLEQQGREKVFRLRFMQRGGAGQREEAVETSDHIQCVRVCASDEHLRLGLLRHQEQPIGLLQLHRPEKDQNENTLDLNSPLNPPCMQTFFIRAFLMK